MANDINVLTMSGRLTRDVEVKDVGNDRRVAKFGFASNYYQGKGKDEGTNFLDCNVWGPKADVLSQYAKKGMRLVITGNLKTDTWEKDGEKKSKMVVDVQDFTFAESASKKDDLPVKIPITKKSVKKEVETSQEVVDDILPEIPF